MSKIDEYARERSMRDSEFAKEAVQDNMNLEVAVQVRDLRNSLGLSQREFAKLVGKPQSTIARIESGSMNASTKLLSEIAQATNQKVKIEFMSI
ncbi:helix-turn-helix transcriptional regulator [Lactobacillus sp. ESL0684]|uniref:helix-turn-helix transcriptional regulator n=1 Tax=Lactobacillus sp. ESL0684 TaxID=2983213 RepID=UPI0023F75532|nr:helix-turn-helix transcriptional regulator [Lactobacillus sp. ESL0684]WEV43386.1 helix-turn-helix transcriptional regulator [Lactobacillus sp. ESL0684]